MNLVYRKAILKALEDLHDYGLRSNVDAIRKNVQSTLEEDHTWNEIVFMKTLKSVVSEGEVEQCTFVNCALSPEYKRKRANSLNSFVEQKRAQGAIVEVELEPQLHPLHHGCEDSPKMAPKRKSEHEKWKIMPKKLYDKTQML